MSASTLTKKEIDLICENWIELTHVEKKSAEHYSYGWKSVKIPAKNELKKQWEILCKKKSKLDNQHAEMREMLLVATPHPDSLLMNI